MKKILNYFKENKMLLFLVVSVLLGSSSVQYYISMQESSASSWLSGWEFSKSISINGSVGAGTDYQVLLKIGESSGASNFDFELENKSEIFPATTDDGGDLRFTADDAETLLPFWVEKVDGISPNRTAHVWVKVSSNLDSNQDIYCYYGNDSASNLSDVSSTFIREIDSRSALVAGYNFDEGSGLTANDSSGNANNATINNGASFVSGVFNDAIRVDGDDDYLSVANNASLNMTDELTISAWVKWNIDPSTGSQWASIVNKNVDSQYRFQHNHNNSFFEFAVRTTSGGRWVNSLTSPVVGQWYHIVGTYDGAILKIYVDGVLENTNNHSGTILTSTNQLTIGSRSIPDRYFNGDIDELMIFNATLTADEISDIYQNYAFSTTDYPGKVLIRKYISPEPSFASASIELVSNQKPDKPLNSSPLDGALEIDINPSLIASSYNDFEGDSQIDTQWQVDNNSDFSSPVWTRTAGSSETSTVINDTNGVFANELSGKTQLNHNSTYYFRVRYSDSKWSDWSDETSFTTAESWEETWLLGWQYRKPFELTGQAPAGTDYQVLLKIGESEGASDYDFEIEGNSALFPTTTDDGGDLRFTADDGETLYPFWVEKVDGISPDRTAHVWVKVLDDLDTDLEMFIYYGNASASNSSNLSDTFIREIKPGAGLLAGYNMDESRGSISHDLSGNLNHANFGGAPDWVSGKYFSALEFDGASDYLVVPHDSSLDLTDKGTLSAWVKINSFQDYGGIIHKGHLSSFADDSYFLQFGGPASGLGNNRKIIGGGHDGTENVFIVSDRELYLDNWYHLLYTWDSLGQRLYIDGVLDTSSPTVFNARTTVGDIQIGSQLPDDYRFNGVIDELLIINDSVNSDEVVDLYNNYGYLSDSYSGSVLVRKFISPAPTFSSAGNQDDGIPLAPSVLTGTALSSTLIKWDFADNSSNELGFRLYDDTDTLASSLAVRNQSSIDESSLSENTLYEGRYLKTYNSKGESDASAVFAGVYTLVDTPSNLNGSANSNGITLTVDSFPNDNSGNSGYYFSRTDGGNSGWIQTNTWTDTSVSCGNNYEYSLKYRNGDGNETSLINKNVSSLACAPSGGGGGGGVVLLPVIQSQEKIQREKDEEEAHSSAQEDLIEGESDEGDDSLPFTDISNHWAKEFILNVYNLGFVNGYNDKSFKPDQPITRAELSKIVAVWFEKDILDSVCDEGLYIDVSCADWYGKYISFLSSKGVLNGYGDGRFLPNNKVSRAEALKVVLYALKLEKSSYEGVANPFKDVSAIDWFYNVVMIGYSSGKIDGYPDGTFRPNNAISRAEFAKIFTVFALE
jgi:hypothetical protein